uniref:Uncharacterized protein n=1 Tax=Rangifer tarandus platyrhynchus TaxID=3082113 RepID=A0ACB0FKP3_RANTA|nr:unnamed protein product [Rangifer tarandus platyrhynchus]
MVTPCAQEAQGSRNRPCPLPAECPGQREAGSARAPSLPGWPLPFPAPRAAPPSKPELSLLTGAHGLAALMSEPADGRDWI